MGKALAAAPQLLGGRVRFEPRAGEGLLFSSPFLGGKEETEARYGSKSPGHLPVVGPIQHGTWLGLNLNEILTEGPVSVLSI